LMLTLTCTALGTLGCMAFNNANWHRNYLFEKINSVNGVITPG
jgi:hypothetical protein